MLFQYYCKTKLWLLRLSSARHWHCSLIGEYQHFRAIRCPSSALKRVRWGLSWVIYAGWEENDLSNPQKGVRTSRAIGIVGKEPALWRATLLLLTERTPPAGLSNHCPRNQCIKAKWFSSYTIQHGMFLQNIGIHLQDQGATTQHTIIWTNITVKSSKLKKL